MKGIKRIVVFIAMVLSLLQGEKLHAAVVTTVGAQAECTIGLGTCGVTFPVALSVLCISTNLSCPDKWHPSWTTTGRFWGTRDGDCVTSTNSGATWAACTAQPFVADTGANVASTFDGSLIAAGNPGGVCTVKKSVDNGTIWTTVFTDATQCSLVLNNSQRLLCQQVGGQCDFVSTVGGVARSYRTTNNGDNWTITNYGASAATTQYNLVFDGNNGANGGSFSTGTQAVYATSNLFALSTAWPGSAAAYLGGMAFLNASTPNIVNGKGTAILDRTDVNGTVLGTIAPVGMLISGGIIDNTVGVFNYSGNLFYIIAPSTVGQGFWISTDGFSTTISLGTNARIWGRPTIFKIGNKVYYSICNGNFGVIQ